MNWSAIVSPYDDCLGGRVYALGRTYTVSDDNGKQKDLDDRRALNQALCVQAYKRLD